MVLAQLGSNPAISNFEKTFVCCYLRGKDENKKSPGMAQFEKEPKINLIFLATKNGL